MENKQFYIKYLTNQPIKVETHIDTQRKRRDFPLTDVGDLIGAVKQALSSKLGSVDLDELTLYTAVELPAIPGNTLLTSLQLPIASYEHPLIIKSRNDAGQGIVDGLTVGLVDTEQSASSMLQIEVIKTEIRKLQESNSKLQESNSKLQETVSNYIQKAETIQISKLTVDKLEKDGFTLIASSVNSINDSDYQILDRFHKFEWPAKNSEKDKRNKDAYLEYLTAFTESFSLLQVKISIESPHLNTVVGIDPHHLNGEADLYVMPKRCRLIYRNQLSMVFEMKPNDISSNNLAQAVGYVIAANSLFDIPGRPSPVGVLSDFIDQWYLIWIGKEGEVFYAGMEKDLELKEKPLTRLTALYYVQKHFENYNQLLKSEDSEKRRAEHFGWAFDGFEAGSLKKQKMAVAEDNMRDLLETDEEIAIYDMNKRLRDTPLFQIPPSDKVLSYYS
jgi:hypothetical protein